jgi:ATP-dependent DNA helicase DinG
MIDATFGPEGLLSEKFAGYAPRKGQVDMARAVEAAIAKREHLVVEGPTGTGKSLAYLVPSIASIAGDPEAPRGAAGRGRVIVVTANIALQEQLVGKDLPLLKEILGLDFDFALAKGKSNYLCLDALGRALGEGLLGSSDPAAKQLERLLAWAQSTETGDVSEFPETPSPAAWRKISTSADECKGSGCKFRAQCFAEKAKVAFSNADVVVTNYHLFFAHLLVRAKMRELKQRGAPVEIDVVLPPAGVVVFDEAHKAADIAREFLGFQLSAGQVEWLVRGFDHELANDAIREARSFFSAAYSHFKSRSYKARLKKGHPLDATRLAEVLDRVSKFYKDAIGAGSWSPDETAELAVRQKRGATLAAQFRMMTKPENFADQVFFLEENARGRNPAVVVRSKPIEVGPFLEKELFSEFGTVVLTSATLATGSGSAPFSWVKKELGLTEKHVAAELLAESPFSWKDQVMLVVPDTMCMPDDRERFPEDVADHVFEATEAAGGRTLGLFTSYKNLEKAHARIAETRPNYRVMKQGEKPRTALVKDFREDVTSVLLGVESFWAGVDVPGESLSCVVIDRLPFPTPDDPIIDAIAEKDDKWFFNVAVPRAIIQFKQGFGRLIRTTSDVGCVVVLDRRVREKSYGRSFLAALPRGIAMSTKISDVAAFLSKERAA